MIQAICMLLLYSPEVSNLAWTSAREKRRRVAEVRVRPFFMVPDPKSQHICCHIVTLNSSDGTDDGEQEEKAT